MRQDIISGRKAAYLQRSASLCCPQSLPQPAAACTPATCQNRIALHTLPSQRLSHCSASWRSVHCNSIGWWKPSIALLPAACTTCAGHSTVVRRAHNSKIVLFSPEIKLGNSHLAGVDRLLQRASSHQAVHGHVAALPNAECAVLRLQVVARVPAGVHYHHPARKFTDLFYECPSQLNANSKEGMVEQDVLSAYTASN